MNRNSHLLLMTTPQVDIEVDKENGFYSQALNSSNLARRQSVETRVPFG